MEKEKDGTQKGSRITRRRRAVRGAVYVGSNYMGYALYLKLLLANFSFRPAFFLIIIRLFVSVLLSY